LAKGEKIRFNSSWISLLDKTKFEGFLHSCDLVYVGGSLEYWDWIFIGSDNIIDNSKIKYDLLYLVVKVFKLAIIVKASNEYAKESNPLKLVQFILKTYGLGSWSEKVFRVSSVVYKFNVSVILYKRLESGLDFKYVSDYLENMRRLDLLARNKQRLRPFETTLKVNCGDTFLCYSQNKAKVKLLSDCYKQIYATGELLLNKENLAIIKNVLTDDMSVFLLLQGLYQVGDYNIFHDFGLDAICAENGYILYCRKFTDVVKIPGNVRVEGTRCVLYLRLGGAICSIDPVQIKAKQINDDDELSGEEFYIT